MIQSTLWTLDRIPDQTGRIAVVTGANSGIGYVTASELARKGALVVLACRDAGRGQSALAQIQCEVPGARVELGSLDLAAQRSIHAFARTFPHERIDLLINNAGVANVPYARTADGFESHFGINHLGTFALTGLLLPRLLTAPAPRVVTVTSEGQRFTYFDFKNLHAERFYNAFFAYLQSKRANLYFAAQLQRLADASGRTLLSAAAAPGLTRTNILTGGANRQRGQLYQRLIRTLIALAFRPTLQGAKTSLFAATMPDVPAGAYVVPNGALQMWGEPTLRQHDRALRHAEAAEGLWQLSEQLTGVSYASVLAPSPQSAPSAKQA
jgi:NAD(P)-dependent dehydrogenase (short-subunit alcohol dehydrogenase family)